MKKMQELSDCSSTKHVRACRVLGSSADRCFLIHFLLLLSLLDEFLFLLANASPLLLLTTIRVFFFLLALASTIDRDLTTTKRQRTHRCQ
jgi:hypothetical protein